ncbi:MAG: UDP-4-amino-4,6-dideoxy-N-acetyl-beta-L-altrosamine transaminase [Gammaproteobacteria bacterium]|nr:UDP-4-amino-4,6-dideoxy-N-acetyl-beta-L-altrosamine transaminase [Gammaproteobacteria bacterium]
MIPYGRQWISADDVAAVAAVLESDFLTQGPVVPAFESAVAGYCGVAHAVAVNSASSALHLACRALDLGPGDCLWTSPNTFVATANCARHCGAQVDFVDVDPDTGNLCPRRLAAKLERAAAAGRLPRVLVPVHFAGQPCDMEAIGALAQRYGIAVIEDAAHALGARYRGTRIGDCRYAQMAVFSFHAVKLITTGEGGMVTTPDPALARRLQSLRSHGITREPAQMENDSEGGWYYEQIALGHNFRMTDIQAALGLSQLRRIDAFLDRRRALAARYDRRLAALPLRRPVIAAHTDPAWHLYVVQLAPGQRRSVYTAMRAAGIGVNVHYIPVYRHPYYRRLGLRREDYPQTERYYAGALTLPLHPQLDEAGQEHVIETLQGALAAP